ncbi:MAG: TadE/TadG family type IV pilus assembly protein [Pseudomonadota bacterium]
MTCFAGFYGALKRKATHRRHVTGPDRDGAGDRFIKDKRGSTALEFGLVSLPFLGLVMSVIEVGMLYFTSAAVDDAVQATSRLIRTGQVQADNLSQDDFRQLICDRLSSFGPCSSKLTVEVRNFSNFSGLPNDAPVCSNSSSSTTSYDPGSSGEVIMVRVCYVYKIFTPGLGINLADFGQDEKAVVSTLVFRNEPFSFLTTSS